MLIQYLGHCSDSCVQMHGLAVTVILGDKILLFLAVGVHASTWFQESANVDDLKFTQSIAETATGVFSFLILHFFVNSVWL